jgi:hypothetical protein
MKMTIWQSEGLPLKRLTASWGVIPASIGTGAAGSSQLTASKCILPRKEGSYLS